MKMKQHSSKHQTRCPFHQPLWHFFFTSNIKSGAILNRNWNLFHSDWRGLRHHQCRVTRKCKNKKAKLFLTKPSINYIFLVNETTLLCEGKRQWIAIKRDIEWMWKILKFVAYCLRLMDCFLLHSIHRHASSPVRRSVQCVAYKNFNHYTLQFWLDRQFCQEAFDASKLQYWVWSCMNQRQTL